MRKQNVLVILSLLMIFIAFGLFAQAPEEVMSAKINNDQIEVTFNIPDDMYINHQEDFFFIEADEVDGISFDPTI